LLASDAPIKKAKTNLGSSKYIGSPAEEDVHDGCMSLLGSKVKRSQTILQSAKHTKIKYKLLKEHLIALPSRRGLLL